METAVKGEKAWKIKPETLKKKNNVLVSWGKP